MTYIENKFSTFQKRKLNALDKHNSQKTIQWSKNVAQA